MGLSTHILDIGRGKPVAGVAVTVERKHPQGFVPAGKGVTDADGRIKPLLDEVDAGIYRLTFDVKGAFFPEVQITFEVTSPTEHYHVPLLLSPYGYSTYRG